MLLTSFLLNMINLTWDGRIQKHFRGKKSASFGNIFRLNLLDRNKPCPCICFVPRGPVQDFQEMLNPDNSLEEPFNFRHWTEHSNRWERFIWVMSYPWEIVMCSTIPNVRRNHWRKCYVMGFIMSMVWISVLTYFISWMLTVVGELNN